MRQVLGTIAQFEKASVVAKLAPGLMVSLTDDERYHVKLRWGDFRAEFIRSIPEDAAHTLWDRGYRGTFSIRWPDSSVTHASAKGPKTGGPEAPSYTLSERASGTGPNQSPGDCTIWLAIKKTALRRAGAADLVPRCFRALGRETLFDVVQAGRG